MTRVSIFGGTGLIGTHLTLRLLAQGAKVTCIDIREPDLSPLLAEATGNPDFEFIRHNVTRPLKIECDRIYNLASPSYMHHPAGNDPANQHPGIDTHLGLSTPQQSTAAVRLVGRHLPNAQRHIVARTASRRQLLLDSERSQALGRGAAPRLHTPVRRRRTSGAYTTPMARAPRSTTDAW